MTTQSGPDRSVLEPPAPDDSDSTTRAAAEAAAYPEAIPSPVAGSNDGGDEAELDVVGGELVGAENSNGDIVYIVAVLAVVDDDDSRITVKLPIAGSAVVTTVEFDVMAAKCVRVVHSDGSITHDLRLSASTGDGSDVTLLLSSVPVVEDFDTPESLMRELSAELRAVLEGFDSRLPAGFTMSSSADSTNHEFGEPGDNSDLELDVSIFGPDDYVTRTLRQALNDPALDDFDFTETDRLVADAADNAAE